MDGMFASAEESNKSRFDSYSVKNSVVHPILACGILACPFFPTTFLETAVFIYAHLARAKRSVTFWFVVC